MKSALLTGETRLEDAEEKSHRVKGGHVTHEQHAGRRDAPEHEDAAERSPGAHPWQHEVARQFKQHVAYEEDARADPVCGVRESQVSLHLELGEPDIDAIQIRKHVAGHEKRQEPPVELAVERGDIVARGRWVDC